MSRYPLPKRAGYYWAQWRIASDGTADEEDFEPRTHWEVVEVCDNNGEPGTNEEYSVHVAGVEQTQWPDQFVWGPQVEPFKG